MLQRLNPPSCSRSFFLLAPRSRHVEIVSLLCLLHALVLCCFLLLTPRCPVYPSLGAPPSTKPTWTFIAHSYLSHPFPEVVDVAKLPPGGRFPLGSAANTLFAVWLTRWSLSWLSSFALTLWPPDCQHPVPSVHQACFHQRSPPGQCTSLHPLTILRPRQQTLPRRATSILALAVTNASVPFLACRWPTSCPACPSPSAPPSTRST